MAVAGFATGVWKSEAEGVKLLDEATAEWKKSDKLRNDFKTESFLGVPGETWTREVMKRVVIDAKCDFRKGKFVQANEHGEPTKIQYTNKPMAKVDVTADSLIFISGVVNPSYLRPDGTRETLFPSSAKDNPMKDRASWQHSMRPPCIRCIRVRPIVAATRRVSVCAPSLPPPAADEHVRVPPGSGRGARPQVLRGW